MKIKQVNEEYKQYKSLFEATKKNLRNFTILNYRKV